jgi:recombination protein RecA
MSPPLKVAEFDIYYGRGVDLVGSLLNLAIQAEIFIQKGAWISYNGENYAQGRENAIGKLKQDQKLLQTIKDLVFNESE